MYDVQRLRIFRAVVAAGSVGGAATSLGFTASAVSQQVTALQRQTGLRLLERRGRGVVPTPAGLRFAQESERVLRELSGLQSMADDLRAGRLGSLTIRSIASVSTAFLPTVVAALTVEFPELRLQLRLVELDESAGGSTGGSFTAEPDLDIFVQDPAAAAIGDLGRPALGAAIAGEVHPLLVEPYVVVLPRTHPFADRTTIALRELESEMWVDNDLARGACREVVLRACAATGFQPNFRIEAQDYPSALAFVAAGAGITVLPRLGVHGAPAGVVAVPLVDPQPERTIMLSVRSEVRDLPAVRRAWDLISDTAVQHGAPAETRSALS